MRRIYLFLSSVVFLFIPISCNSEQNAVNELEKFVEYMQENSDELDGQALEEASQRYAEIVEKLDSHVYDENQLEQIGRLKGKCAALFAKRSLRDAEDGFNEFLNEAGGFVQGLIESFTGDTDQSEPDME